MVVTQYPGFANPVIDSQQTFRALLMAMAHPGEVYFLSSPPPSLPPDLAPATGAALLTLLDLETSLWLTKGWSEEVLSWIQFHTGCRICAQPQQANFALLRPQDPWPALKEFAWGTPEIPEASTTLLLQLADLDLPSAEYPLLNLRGPGIQSLRQLRLPITPNFWQQWGNNQHCYPLGIDLHCLAGDRLLGLPRTTQVTLSGSDTLQAHANSLIEDVS